MGLFTNFAKDLPDVTSKVFVITGTTSGTGFIAAETAAKNGGEVILLNRPSARSDASLEKLRKAVPDAKFVPIACDLQDFASVRSACAEIQEKYDTIYCLANNAGVMATPDAPTKDGYDTQMQTNHFSHFLITKELFPLLVNGMKKYDDARIVQHSSGARKMTKNKELEEKYLGPNGGNLGGDEDGPTEFSGPKFDRYAQSKLANAVNMYALHDKLKVREEYKNIRAVAAHPGLATTSMGMRDFGFFSKLFRTFMAQYMMGGQTAEDGAMGLIKCMMDPDVKSGTLYGPPEWKGAAVPNPPEPYENDTEAKKMLWEMSEKAVKVKFEI
jgi:NAD(P)-dependent dehydrogenase (short-subunit alcohol dehydrogenase family)